MVFRWPPNPSFDFIKRVIGLPGDHISYVNKELYVNGKQIPQDFISEYATDQEWAGTNAQVIEKQEDLLACEHKIYTESDNNRVMISMILLFPKACIL